ncbi:SpoIIE family protein phosphatase [[Phormidium] sp. ETS-05]|uniref:SpoIIE family protein phosphatase n=1 Tax=[Phormidium] sp. ETS-05 TaxID=222819 RepID=UPI0031FE4B31
MAIGAYRDNEVSETHPLVLTLDRLKQAGTKFTHINLQPLTREKVQELIVDTLNGWSETSQQLVNLIYNKTGGNPFFVAQLLHYLYQEYFFVKNQESGIWECDINQIEGIGITDNVVELMIAKIEKLEEATKTVLKLAACVGNRFDLETLALVSDQSPSLTAKAIFPAIKDGLILPLNDAYKIPVILDGEEGLNFEDLARSGAAGASDYPAYIPYKFVHDRIQQAAYALIPSEQKKQLHLSIGEMMLKNTHPDQLEENIFQIVNHLNQGVDLIGNSSEKLSQLAALNLNAGKKAKDSVAYETAGQYLDVALNALNADSWQTNYDLTIAIYLEALELQYLNTRFEAAEKLGSTILQAAHILLDRVKVYEMKIQFYYAQLQLQLAIETALEILEELGIVLPQHPTELQIEEEQKAIARLLANREIKDLANLPEMTDPHQLAALRILLVVTSAAIISNPLLCPLVTMTSVKLCMEHGNSPLAAGAYIFYAQLLCGVMKNIDWGYQFCQLSLILAKNLTLGNLQSVVIHYSNGIRHWKEPFSSIKFEEMQDGVQIGIETGNFENACYNAIDFCLYSILAGRNLEEFLPQYNDYTNLTIKLKQAYAIYYIKATRAIALNLISETSENAGLIFSDSWDEEKIILQQWEQNNFHYLLFITYITQAIVWYILRRFDLALDAASKGMLVGESSGAYIPFPQHNFYFSLSLLAVVKNIGNHPEKAQIFQQVQKNQERMKEWAMHAPENYQNKYLLINAELANVLGNYWEASELYEQAISAAKQQKFIHEEAIAYERAAEFYLSLGRDEIGMTYLKNAYHCYASWGAKAKVKSLEAEHSQVVVGATNRSGSKGLSITTTGSDKNSLDLATVVKASQAIAAEILLDKLLAKLMRLVIENAGAEKGFLILPRGGDLWIEAAGIAEDEEVTALQSISVNTSTQLSPGIVNYVARTRSSVVLSDAANSGTFTTEPYIVQNQPKSVLCAPIINQGQLTGIIYLENNLITSAFTTERLEIVSILSAQAAISIENALLYRTLEDKVQERTAQLAESNAQLAAANMEISVLNERLKAENIRMAAELDVTRQLQQMILPKKQELEQIPNLEIAGFMEPADEVGGDYYDVLNYDGRVKIGIGDVTGHGLESGMLMIMVQTAVRTLLAHNETDYVKFLSTINRTIYDNVARMKTDKNLTLALLDYADGVLSVSGQHEEIIVVRDGGIVELIDTIDLGFPIGLDSDIADFISQAEVRLHPGDVAILYTDGITEAENMEGVQYGLERLCEVVSRYWQQSAEEIRAATIADVRDHIGEQKVFDDITLVVIKQR